MCDMTAVALGAEATGTLISGFAAKQRGDAARGEADRAANADERAAADAVERGKLKEAQVAAHGAAVVGEQRLFFSATGADVNIGAPKAVQEATEAATAADKRVVAYNATLQGYGLKLRARATRQRGANAQAEGNAQMVGTFLSGIGKVAGQVGRRVAGMAGDEMPDTSYGGGDAPDEAD